MKHTIEIVRKTLPAITMYVFFVFWILRMLIDPKFDNLEETEYVVHDYTT